jgi:hypothetical protein
MVSSSRAVVAAALWVTGRVMDCNQGPVCISQRNPLCLLLTAARCRYTDSMSLFRSEMLSVTRGFVL